MNLHSFSNRGSDVCRSLFLRTIMVMMFFITGSNGIYAGEDLKATLPITQDGTNDWTWDPSQNRFSWSNQWGNLMPIFTNLKGKLNTNYVALKFTTRNYVNDQPYRVCFMNGTTAVATKTYNFAGEITIKLSELGDLSQVDNIKFGGGYMIMSGSITLDPESIVLVGQLQNNTKRFDLPNFILTDKDQNVESVVYEVSALKVTTKGENTNYFPLYKDFNGKDYTGVRLTAKGVKFRIVAKTSDNKIFQVKVDANPDAVTIHKKWEDFAIPWDSNIKMTEADVAKITQIGLAGDNAAGETGRVFYVQEFWLDDIADYDKTIPCYGDEGGVWDWAQSRFVYTTAGATAVFEGSDTRDGNHNIILKSGSNLTLSSDVNKFTEVCLVFGAETTYDLKVAGTQYTGTSTAVICPVNSSELTILNNSSSAIYLSKIIYSSEKAGINEERTITVDGKTRKYWLYVPASLAETQNVPVVFSLHGRGNNDNPNEGGKPVFTSLAKDKEKGFIVVYPQGRNGGSEQDRNDYPGDWYNGFAGNTGWEATGKENADTKFIKALVDQIQSDYQTQTDQNSHISVDPKRFYLCGFSMGGMMTYACAKVLNGTFAAYGSNCVVF